MEGSKEVDRRLLASIAENFLESLSFDFCHNTNMKEIGYFFEGFAHGSSIISGVPDLVLISAGIITSFVGEGLTRRNDK